MTSFAETLYEENKRPLHLVLDEADLWVPQRAGPEQLKLLGLIDEIVRRGRTRGFIPWLISQRPAVIHKDVLAMAQVLVTMQLTLPHDLKAMRAWIEGQAPVTVRDAILTALPGLQQGEGYIYAPLAGVLSRMKFPAITTYDSSRTPKHGEQEASGGIKLPPINMAALKDALVPPGRVTLTSAGKEAAGGVQPAPATRDGLLALWRKALPSPAPDMLGMLDTLGGEATIEQLSSALNRKPVGGHWNTGISHLRANGLVKIEGRTIKLSEAFDV